MPGESDRRALLELGELLEIETGICLGGLREDLVSARLSRRMQAVGARNLAAYVKALKSGKVGELQEFINLMTTNHTYFFREQPHLDFIASVFLPRFVQSGQSSLNIWCAACSTGEEVYTVAMIAHRVLHRMRARVKVSVLGTDINTEALRIGAQGVYPGRRLENVPKCIRRECLRQGRFPHHAYYKVAPEIQEKVRFAPANLIRPVEMFQSFDLVLCRNVLIYFDRSTVRKVVQFLRSRLTEDGVFITGLSEQVDNLDPELSLLGRSIHVLHDRNRYKHSAWDTRSLVEVLEGATPSGVAPARRASESGPASTGGAEASPSSEAPAPTPLPAPTPTPAAASAPSPVDEFRRGGAATSVRLTKLLGNSDRKQKVLVAIGSSTGGQQAISEVLRDLPGDFPPVVIAQHIAKGYSPGFARSLDRITDLRVIEATDGAMLQPGHVYVAPGGAHLRIRLRGSRLSCSVSEELQAQAFVPSVDLLFESIAKLAGVSVFAAVLTGMGNDGTRGALALKKRGHWVVAQDAETALVSGMPESVDAAGAAHMRLPITAIGGSLTGRIRMLLGGEEAA